MRLQMSLRSTISNVIRKSWGCRKPRTVISRDNRVSTVANVENTIHGEKVCGHLYLIQEREFIRMGEPIYKVGKTRNIKGRMPAYPKNSILHTCFYTKYNIHEVEKEIIKYFDLHFVKRIDIGYEYYEGELKEMISAYMKIHLDKC